MLTAFIKVLNACILYNSYNLSVFRNWGNLCFTLSICKIEIATEKCSRHIELWRLNPVAHMRLWEQNQHAELLFTLCHHREKGLKNVHIKYLSKQLPERHVPIWWCSNSTGRVKKKNCSIIQDNDKHWGSLALCTYSESWFFFYLSNLSICASCAGLFRPGHPHQTTQGCILGSLVDHTLMIFSLAMCVSCDAISLI